jgi:TonB family protein
MSMKKMVSVIAALLMVVSWPVFGQQLDNPNKLPLCQKFDPPKKTASAKPEQWQNCWGRYTYPKRKGQKQSIEYDEGEWVDGKLNGFGIRGLENGMYVGEFKSGKYFGSGKLTWRDGTEFVGSWKDGHLHGYGLYVYSVGVWIAGYVGNWRNGFYDGLGIKIDSDGNRFEGNWSNGSFIGAAKVALRDDLDSRTSFFSTKPEPGEVQAKILPGNKNPEYPPMSQRLDEQGTVTVKVLVRKDGSAGSVTLKSSSGYPRLDKAAIDAVRTWKFEPSLRAGVPVDREFDLPITFKAPSSPPVSQDFTLLAQQKQRLAEEKRMLEEDIRQQRKYKESQKIRLAVSNTQPSDDGSFFINVLTNSDTASLKIDGEEQGGRKDGSYSVRKVARAGQDTQFTIVATDVNGNTETKTITVNRPIEESKAKFAALNPAQVKKQPTRDAVAIIIGIADYKNLPRADFANDDASVFYDYAVRALGLRPENIKLLVDANADDVAIYQAFKTWLPSRVRPTTDVYVYYSGHGLPAEDGQGLYLLPQRAHRDLIEKTAISQHEINGFIQAAKPKSVTIFLDSCYSGLGRTGETLLTSARPVTIKSDKKLFPDGFTVITASQADQISSSSPDLKHGIFSYYLMRGMEGEADFNRDGKITARELHGYLAEQVARQAGMMNRQQEPQLMGDANRVLVGN